MFELPPPSYWEEVQSDQTLPVGSIGNLLLHGSSTSHFVWSDRLPMEKHTYCWWFRNPANPLGMYPKPLIKKMVDFNHQPQVGRNSSWIFLDFQGLPNKDPWKMSKKHRPRRPQLELEELDLAAAFVDGKKTCDPRFLDEDFCGKLAENTPEDERLVHLSQYTLLEKEKIIWTKPSWLQVRTVNLRGCIIPKPVWFLGIFWGFPLTQHTYDKHTDFGVRSWWYPICSWFFHGFLLHQLCKWECCVFNVFY